MGSAKEAWMDRLQAEYNDKRNARARERRAEKRAAKQKAAEEAKPK
jgi:hypothetical protein